MTDMVAEMAERLFSSVKAGGDSEDALWEAVEEAGLPFALLSEDEGGFDFTSAEALEIVRIGASHAIAAPIAETMLTNRVLAASGLELAQGPAAVVSDLILEGGRLSGTLRRVPWGRNLKTVAALTTNGRALRLTAGWSLIEGTNLAGEPRDDMTFDLSTAGVATSRSPVDAETTLAMMAALRAIAMAGAAEAALTMTIGYANDRVQFGRPLARQQAIQQQLSIMASQAAAARCAAHLAAEAFPLALTAPRLFHLRAGVAKLRAGEAAGICASIAHQVHGAMGFTAEYALHPLTRRLWAWRDEYGSEADWARKIGAAAFAQSGGEDLWPFLTQTDEAA